MDLDKLQALLRAALFLACIYLNVGIIVATARPLLCREQLALLSSTACLDRQLAESIRIVVHGRGVWASELRSSLHPNRRVANSA